MQYRSEAFKKIADDTAETYTGGPKNEGDSYWFKKYAPLWRNRVGLPRLVADVAMVEALSLLRSINRGIFRNDEEMRGHYDEALEALEALVIEFSRQNWQRFEGRD